MEEVTNTEVVETTQEQVEDIDLGGGDNVEVQEQEPTEVEVEVEEEFDPENLFNEDDVNADSFKFGDYNLEKYKDVLDFSDEELTKEFTEKAEQYQKLGFTQEQIEFILDEKINDAREVEELRAKKPTQKEIRERLQSSLSNEEIRNYKPTTNYVKDLLNGTEFESKANEILQNPILVKLFHQAYKKSLNKTTNVNAVSKRPEANVKSMTFEEADQKLQLAFGKGRSNAVNVAKELLSSLSGTDKQQFLELLQVVGIN